MHRVMLCDHPFIVADSVEIFKLHCTLRLPFSFQSVSIGQEIFEKALIFSCTGNKLYNSQILFILKEIGKNVNRLQLKKNRFTRKFMLKLPFLVKKMKPAIRFILKNTDERPHPNLFNRYRVTNVSVLKFPEACHLLWLPHGSWPGSLFP